MTEPVYELRPLTARQAQVLAAALELYARIGMGQLQCIIDEARTSRLITTIDGAPVPLENIEQAETLMRQVKWLLTGCQPNTSKGIGGPATPRDAQVAYEIQKAIRHRLAWDRSPSGGVGVDFDDPHVLRYSGEPAVTLQRQSAAD